MDEGPYAPPGEDRALAAGDNHVPSENRQAPAMGGRPFLSRTQSSSAPLGVGWNHAPLKDRQAPAVDEGPFLSRTQGSSADPDGG